MKRLVKIFIMISVFSVFTPLTFGMSKAEIEKAVNQIRADYNKANAEKNYKVEKQSIEVQTTEGGERIIYSKNGEVKKITITYFGETGKKIEEFYLKNNRPYFLLITDIFYGLVESSKGDGLEIIIAGKDYERYYFNPQGKLIRYINTENKIIEDRKTLEELEKRIEDPMSHEISELED